MAQDKESKRQLAHDLANAEQEKLALQGLLKKAATQIDDLVDSDCDKGVKAKAEKTATKLRRAASM